MNIAKIPSLQSLCFDLTGQAGKCVEKLIFGNSEIIDLLSSLFVPEDLYMVCISFISGKAEIMSFERPNTQYYERRKKRYHDVNASEGSSRDAPLRRSTRAGAHRDLPRGRMDNDSEIEKEHIVESNDDDDVEDENYRISPRATRRAVLDDDEDENMDDVDEVEDELRRQIEEEEEKGAEGNANPQQRGRIPFYPKTTIRKLHKPLRYNAISYRGKGSTKEVKRLQKIDPRPQQKGATDYQFHTHFQQDLYEIVIMVRRRIVYETHWVDWNHMTEQQDPIFNHINVPCECHHIKKLMGFHYDWNIEVIAQF
jgi:hypothetical protein